MYGSNNMKKLVVLGWSVCSGIRWSVSTGNDGQFAPEIGGQFDRIFHQVPHSMLQVPHSMLQVPCSILQVPHSMLHVPRSILRVPSSNVYATIFSSS